MKRITKIIALVIAMVMVLPQEHLVMMLQRTSVQPAGVCLLVVAVENTKHYMLNIVVLPKAKLLPLEAPSLRPSLANSTMAWPAIRVPPATSGRLRGALTTVCTTSPSIRPT